MIHGEPLRAALVRQWQRNVQRIDVEVLTPEDFQPTIIRVGRQIRIDRARFGREAMAL